MSLDVQHDLAAQRFVAMADGEQCVLEYRLVGTTMTITHTSVPAAVGGRGIAGVLMRAALDAARIHGWKVVPACSYAQAFFDRQTEYADLLA